LILVLIPTLGYGPVLAQPAVGVRERQPAGVERRVALVIGNANYGRAMGRLINPANDAMDMAAPLPH